MASSFFYQAPLCSAALFHHTNLSHEPVVKNPQSQQVPAIFLAGSHSPDCSRFIQSREHPSHRPPSSRPSRPSIPFTRDQSTAHHMLRTTSASIIAAARIGPIARVLTVLISGSSLPRGSHDRNNLLGTSFSMASFFYIAANNATAALLRPNKTHWSMDS
ncbi:uncharacterized protein LY79DRAFT_99532 [Colletotrichum navitas]|uniref:Uncharacterized protein n=1 Tax=Colletotrichum navitas TaxID=681940 RepID=A0AAD8Q3V7_9PEZI|nr:uncharacterized protein LY79DRAFT_99532 [Colletotrichum navitas]KAK1595471.1 hypothetical protein LY79DRAFT_99532 [Colletotrichum navitas]